ncbi:hypothetical protein [Endozoicomonas sp.]|uniref:hypothetical protein n=1 Tax=Endozoicomonas sp. TaxID=1892382 RepID=UPI002886C07B|nr:hypothetical protein [Endozoicomonas sp.]
MFLSIFSRADTVEPTLSYQEALSTTLDSLLSELNIPHAANLDSMINASQVWRRKPGQERWELPELDIPAEKKSRVFELLEKLGLMASVVPTGKHYDSVLFLGATVPAMKHRLDNLIHLWNEGVRFRRLIYLVGQRPLDPTTDHLKLLAILPEDQHSKTLDPYPFTETEAAMMLHQLAPMPAAMKALPIEFIDTPRKWRNGYWHRPNTRDTLKHWKKNSPSPGSTLVISGQPYGNYQKEVVRQELPEGFLVDLAAGSAGSATRLVIYLDALALWLHNLQIPNTSNVAPLKTVTPPGRH